MLSQTWAFAPPSSLPTPARASHTASPFATPHSSSFLARPLLPSRRPAPTPTPRFLHVAAQQTSTAPPDAPSTSRHANAPSAALVRPRGLRTVGLPDALLDPRSDVRVDPVSFALRFGATVGARRAFRKVVRQFPYGLKAAHVEDLERERIRRFRERMEQAHQQRDETTPDEHIDPARAYLDNLEITPAPALDAGADDAAVAAVGGTPLAEDQKQEEEKQEQTKPKLPEYTFFPIIPLDGVAEHSAPASATHMFDGTGISGSGAHNKIRELATAYVDLKDVTERAEQLARWAREDEEDNSSDDEIEEEPGYWESSSEEEEEVHESLRLHKNWQEYWVDHTPQDDDNAADDRDALGDDGAGRSGPTMSLKDLNITSVPQMPSIERYRAMRQVKNTQLSVWNEIEDYVADDDTEYFSSVPVTNRVVVPSLYKPTRRTVGVFDERQEMKRIIDEEKKMKIQLPIYYVPTVPNVRKIDKNVDIRYLKSKVMRPPALRFGKDTVTWKAGLQCYVKPVISSQRCLCYLVKRKAGQVLKIDTNSEEMIPLNSYYFKHMQEDAFAYTAGMVLAQSALKAGITEVFVDECTRKRGGNYLRLALLLSSAVAHGLRVRFNFTEFQRKTRMLVCNRYEMYPSLVWMVLNGVEVWDFLDRDFEWIKKYYGIKEEGEIKTIKQQKKEAWDRHQKAEQATKRHIAHEAAIKERERKRWEMQERLKTRMF